MNKGFEVIEAAWLFGVPADRIDVIVHRESIIHSMVEYIDNMIIAQLGAPDMRSCIQYALTAPDRIEAVADQLDFAKLAKMTFYEPDTEVFPLLALAKRVHSMGGSYGAALNGANEVAVAAFLEDKMTLPELFEAVTEATLASGDGISDIDSVLAADVRARAFVGEYLKSR
jgi:1-deoxy-D-xylulose-5-phosphate reductoisomerase